MKHLYSPITGQTPNGLRQWGKHLAGVIVAVFVVATNVATAETIVCTFAEFQNALVSGGTIKFGCDAGFVFTATRVISVNTTIDANGHTVIFDGYDALHNTAVRLFWVNSGVNFTLRGVT